MSCRHEQFEAKVDVSRLEEPGKQLGLMAEIRIVCLECRQEGQFPGLPVGLLPGGPSVSVDGCELRAPFRLDGTAWPLEMPGFVIERTA